MSGTSTPSTVATTASGVVGTRPRPPAPPRPRPRGAPGPASAGVRRRRRCRARCRRDTRAPAATVGVKCQRRSSSSARAAPGSSQVPAPEKRTQQAVEHRAEQAGPQRSPRAALACGATTAPGTQPTGVLVGLDGDPAVRDRDDLAGQPVLAEQHHVVHRHAGQRVQLHQRARDPEHRRAHGDHSPSTSGPERVECLVGEPDQGVGDPASRQPRRRHLLRGARSPRRPVPAPRGRARAHGRARRRTRGRRAGPARRAARVRAASS